MAIARTIGGTILPMAGKPPHVAVHGPRRPVAATHSQFGS